MQSPSTNIYLDTAASTPIAPEAIAAFSEYLNCYYNPSSNHYLGQQAATAIESARAIIATLFGCESRDVIFTSGATEANNLALFGVARAYADRGNHIITSAIEHKCVLACCEILKQQGFTITYLKPDRGGRIQLEQIQQALRPETLLVSLQHINNETGIIQPIESVAALLNEVGVLFHVDAAQSFGKFPLNMGALGIDLLSVSGHKYYAPKGVGCLIVRNRPHLKLMPLLVGGGQEFGLRSGTLATHQIMAFSAALALSPTRQAADLKQMQQLKTHFIQMLQQALPITVQGDQRFASPYIVNFSIPQVDSDALINQLAYEVALSSGAACSSGTVEPSYVLRAMGIEGDALYGAVRASFGRFHTLADIQKAAAAIIAAAQRIQELS